MPKNELVFEGDALSLLSKGDIEIVQRMPDSSNATFLATVTLEGLSTPVIYKPLRGERPLWDFPPGLHRREVAAYRLSESLGLHFVPPTVLRDGPAGEGSVQFFIDADLEAHYFTLFEQHPELHDVFRAICAFDIVINNTDRKSGHCLIDKRQQVWAIDHGICFSSEFKLRTVIWEFGGEALDPNVRQSIAQLANTVPLDIATLLDDDEVSALQERAKWLADNGVLPVDRSRSRYPWPLV